MLNSIPRKYPEPKKYPWLQNLLTLFVVVIVMLLLAEVVLRLALPQNLLITQYSSELGHELIPSTEITYSSPQGIFTHEYSHPLRINEQGIREDKLYPQDPDSDTFRIAVLGSSFTLGLGVSQEETFEKILERKMNEDLDGESTKGVFDTSCVNDTPGVPDTSGIIINTVDTVEVINFGVQNYKPENQYLLLLSRVQYYHPDLILFDVPTRNLAKPLTFFREEMVEHPGKDPLTTYVYTPKPAPNTRLRFSTFMMRHSHLWSFTSQVLKSNPSMNVLLTKAGIFSQQKETLFNVPSEESYYRDLQHQEQIILRAATFAKNKGIPFIVTITPIKEQIDNRKFEETIQFLPL